jgi:hypothetical protein
MPVPIEQAPWTGSALWLIGLTVASFLVSWLAGNRLQLPRTGYIAVLLVVTAGLTGGYLAWLRIDFGTVLETGWGWGLLAGILAGAVTAAGMTRMPATGHLSGAAEGIAFAWQGLVYGVTEGILLSALPAFMTWQMVNSLELSGVGGTVAIWLLPIVASIVVIVIHHLGYWEYRNRTLVPIVGACALLTVAYLLTASVLAPMLGHVVMHSAAITHGTELPPHPRPAVGSPSPGHLVAGARG